MSLYRLSGRVPADQSEGVFRWMGKRLITRFTGPSQDPDRVICRRFDL
jgi:hypothetical protein